MQPDELERLANYRRAALEVVVMLIAGLALIMAATASVWLVATLSHLRVQPAPSPQDACVWSVIGPHKPPVGTAG